MITESRVVAAQDIFGHSLLYLKGKTNHTKTTHSRTLTADLPPMIFLRYKLVLLAICVMNIKGIDFFVSKSCHINFLTGECIKKNNSRTLLDFISQIKKYIWNGDFYLKPSWLTANFNV